jgi:hypothetical protein
METLREVPGQRRSEKAYRVADARSLMTSLRDEHPALRELIEGAEQVFVGEEVAHDWTGEQIDTSGAGDQPAYWVAGVKLASTVITGYAALAHNAVEAQAFKRLFLEITEAVADDTLDAHVLDYVICPPGWSLQDVVNRFALDVWNGSKREVQLHLKKVQLQANDRRLALDVSAQVNDAHSVPSPTHLKRRRAPHANPESLLAGKTVVTFDTAAEVLGMTVRRVRELVAEQKLNARGAGHSKKIEVSSLRKYAGLLEIRNNPEHGGI